MPDADARTRHLNRDKLLAGIDYHWHELEMF
jgi:hypothetical protein